jgi:hypothetical protein
MMPDEDRQTPSEQLAAKHDAREVLHEAIPGPLADQGAQWLDGEIARLREEIQQLVEWQRDDLTAKAERMKDDGALVFETIGDDLHAAALEIDRRIASVVSLQRASELLRALGALPI